MTPRIKNSSSPAIALHSSKVLLYHAPSTTSSSSPSVLGDKPEKGFFGSTVPLNYSYLPKY